MSGDWETYYTWARLGNPKAEAEPAFGGFDNYKIFYTAIGIAPTGL